MDKSGLLKEISNTLVKAKVEKLAAVSSENSFSLSDLIDLTFYPKKEIAFRAAWILEHITQSDPKRFFPFIIEFLNRYPQQENPSCCRHFTKIMTGLTQSRRTNDLRIPDGYNMEPIVEKTFEWLINNRMPVAVQVYCIDVLFNLRHQFPWISEELKAEISFLLHDGSAAMQSRGKAVLKKMGK